MPRSRVDLPHSLSPNTSRCGSVAKSRQTGRRSASAMPIGSAGPLAGRRRAGLGRRQPRGSSRTVGAGGTGQARATGPTSVGHRLGQVVRRSAGRRPAAARPGSAAVRGSGRGPGGRPARSRRPGGRSSESAGSPRRSSSRVPNRSVMSCRKSTHRVAVDDDVDAVAQPPGGEVGERRLELLELLAQRGPAVDDQEHVAERVVGDLVRSAAAPPVGGHRVDAVLRRSAAPARRAAWPPRRPCAGPLRVQPAGDAADVRQAAQRRQRAAAEVEAVELHLARRVGERERGDAACAAACDLPALRAADDDHVAAGAGQVEPATVAALLERLVDDRRPAPCSAPAQRPARPVQAAVRVDAPAAAAARPASADRPAAAARPGAPAGPGRASRSTMTSSIGWPLAGRPVDSAARGRRLGRPRAAARSRCRTARAAGAGAGRRPPAASAAGTGRTRTRP